jgi:hypothetical protein
MAVLGYSLPFRILTLSRCQVPEPSPVVGDDDYDISSIGTFHSGNKCVSESKNSRPEWTVESVQIVKNVSDPS